MRKEMVIRVQTNGDKGGSCKAVKVAAGVKGVESVTITGEGKNLLLVIGVGIDANRITKKLRQKVGHAEVVELRSVDAAAANGGLVVPADHAYRFHPSPYKHQSYHTAAAQQRDHYYGGYPRDDYHKHQQHAGGRDYYYAGGGGGYYPPAQYQQHHLYQPPPGNVHTVVHHPYADDPNSCSIM